jgi:hypothetical protein
MKRSNCLVLFAAFTVVITLLSSRVHSQAATCGTFTSSYCPSNYTSSNTSSIADTAIKGTLDSLNLLPIGSACKSAVKALICANTYPLCNGTTVFPTCGYICSAVASNCYFLSELEKIGLNFNSSECAILPSSEPCSGYLSGANRMQVPIMLVSIAALLVILFTLEHGHW